MEGLNQHLEFQVKLAGGKGGGGEGSSGSYGDQKMMHGVGETPDDIPDIGMMVPIEKVD